MEKELAKLKAIEDRYNKAYGAEVFSLEKLKEFVTPIKSQIATLELQIKKVEHEKTQTKVDSIPIENEVRKFTEAAVRYLKDLSFEMKRVIITNVIEKVIGTQQQLQVSGNIPLTLNYVEYKTSYRHCRSAQCGEIHAF